MHMHMEEHTVLSRVGSTNPHPEDTGKEDVVALDPSESVTFFRRFRTFRATMWPTATTWRMRITT
jgi:hypothetical protein